MVEHDDVWEYSVKAITPCTVLALPQAVFEDLISGSPALHAHVERYKEMRRAPQDKAGQAAIKLSAATPARSRYPGPTPMTGTPLPREYELSLAQTILHVHSRVGDLFNDPWTSSRSSCAYGPRPARDAGARELINNRDFGLLHAAEYKQRINTRTGPPTPDDMDEILLCRRRDNTKCFWLTRGGDSAAFRQECTKWRIDPEIVEFEGSRVAAWRGTPSSRSTRSRSPRGAPPRSWRCALVSRSRASSACSATSSPTSVSRLSVRKMGINDKAIGSYLVSTY